MLRAGRNRFTGLRRLQSTLLIDSFGGIFEGDGGCTEQRADGTCFIYEGVADQPAIKIAQSAEARFANFRVKGNNLRRASAAILVESNATHAPKCTGLTFEGITIGAVIGDPGTTAHFLDGMVCDGDANVQGDQSSINNMFVQNVFRSALAFRKSQQVLWNIQSLRVNTCQYGIETVTRQMTVQSFFPSSVGLACVYMPQDADIKITGFGSEQCGRLLRAVDGFSANFEMGYFQLDDRFVVADGRIIDVNSSSRGVLRLKDVGFTLNVPYNLAVVPRARIRAKDLLVDWNNVSLPLPIDQFLDVQTEGAFDRRRVNLLEVTDPNGVHSGEFSWRAGQAAPIFSINARV